MSLGRAAPDGVASRVLRRVVGRGALLTLRWWMLRALAPRRTVHSRGLTFSLQCDNWITHYRCVSYNSKEPETLEWIDRWLQQGEVLFDIGANIGLYTIYAALRHPGCRVVAFEPEYANLHLLRDNLVHNRLQDRVDVYAMAVGSYSGISRLHIQDFTPGSALHTESREALRTTLMNKPVVWREGIYTTTLDTFCEETHHVPHGIKIDVDGMELRVLEGAPQTLRQSALRSVLMEMPEAQAARTGCERLLAAAGLRPAAGGKMSASGNQLWIR